jgi:hypothetical protein
LPDPVLAAVAVTLGAPPLPVPTDDVMLPLGPDDVLCSPPWPPAPPSVHPSMPSTWAHPDEATPSRMHMRGTKARSVVFISESPIEFSVPRPRVVGSEGKQLETFPRAF